MGKRELLLIAAFVLVGAVVYQATAPPAGPNERSLSLSGIFEKVRREIRGNRAHAEDTKVFTQELDPQTNEVRIAGGYVEVTVTGEQRSDIEARFRVTSNGYDEAEAKRLVGETTLKIDRAGNTIRLTSDYPGPGQQRAWLTLLVPARIAVRLDGGPPRVTVTKVAAVEMPGTRGETTVKQIAGRVTLTHRGGRLAIEDVATIKLTARGSDATVTRVRGDASFSLQSGELTASEITGAIDVESQNAEIVLKKLDQVQGPLRVNATGGSVTIEGLRTDARVDGRNTEIEIAMAKPASVAVYNEGDERIELTTPPGGFVLDAIVTEGRLTLPDDMRGQFTTTGGVDDKEQRAAGAVRGGGPTITLRANRGDIRIVGRETAKP